MATDVKNTQSIQSKSPQTAQPAPTYYQSGSHKGMVIASGIFAGFIFTFTMLLLLWTNITPRSLANLVADRISNLLPGNFTEFFIQSIGPLGKQLEFFSVLAGQTFVGGLLGFIFIKLWPRIMGRTALAQRVFVFTTAIWLLLIGLLLPLVDGGLVGASLGDDQLKILVSSFVLLQIFGLTFLGFFQYLVPINTGSKSILADAQISQIAPTTAALLQPDLPASLTSRRRFVILVGGLFMTIAGAGLIATAFRSSADTARSQLGATLLTDGTLEGEVTPTANFYHVSKNAIDPTVDVASWKLQIDGLVNTTLSLNLAQIRELASQTQYHTLTCISNPVAGPYISTAKWKGVQLKLLLEKAGVKAGVKRVIFRSADGYTDSIEIEKALEPQTLAAYEMNDGPVPSDHGAPLRMLIPNIYGMKNAKWVTSITLTDNADYKGFWQQQGWDNTANIHTESTITYPADNQNVDAGQTLTVRGYAFAGERGVKRVEISTDGGQNWNDAPIKEALSPNAWALWHYDWKIGPSQQDYKLVVRATDKTGASQTSSKADSYPSGASGWHNIAISAITAPTK